MDTARVKRLGGWAIVIASVLAGAAAILMFQVGKAGTPRGAEQLPGYREPEVVVYVPDDVDVTVFVTFRRAHDQDGGEEVTLSGRGASASRPFLAFIELRGSDQLTSRTTGDGLYLRPEMVEVPAVRSPLGGGADAVAPRQMYLAQFGPGDALFGARVAGEPQVAALQSDTSRSVFSSGSILLEKCPGLPRSLVDLRTPTGYDAVRLGRLADFYGGPGSCRPDQSYYRGADRGFVEVRDSQAAPGAVRVDSSTPDTLEASPEAGSPTLEWSWAPHWAGIGTFSAEANFVDINEEAQGQSLLVVSGALIGVASSALPIGIGLVLAPWFTERGGRSAAPEPPPAPPSPPTRPARRRFNHR